MKDLDFLDGDMSLVNGDFAFVTGADEVRQRVLLRLRRQLGEWEFNVTLGVPWIEQILIRNPDLGTIRALLVREIATTPGVIRVVSLELELTADRKLAFTWSALVETDSADVEFADASIVDFDNGTLQFLLEPLGTI